MQRARNLSGDGAWRELWSLEGVIVALAVFFTIAGPLVVGRYPAMTDVPMHASYASIFRHYFDPAFHYQEQFSAHLLEVPHVSLYALAALFMLVVDAVTAIKLAIGCFLALLPLGMAVLCRGMGKSPLLGAAGLVVVWCDLTSWGFIAHMAALGLFALALGLALLQLRRPRLGRGLWLAAVLLLIWLTHPYRVPYAVLAVVGAGVIGYPAFARTRGWLNGVALPVLGPVVAPLVLFTIWWTQRPAAVGETIELGFAPERLADASGLIYGAPQHPGEASAVTWLVWGLPVWALVVAAAGVWRRRQEPRRRLDRRYAVAHVIVGLMVAGYALAYLVLPLRIGAWWYVYPRAVTAAFYLALPLLPDLPKQRWRLAATVALCAIGCRFGAAAIEHHQRFDAATRDFAAITQHIPQAPKLMYLIYDRSGIEARNPLFMHLPAYVQAEKGGWLSFHFVIWDHGPVRYRDRREPGAVVPPRLPDRWEWTPERFHVLAHGRFFDWFLIRSAHNPTGKLAEDPTIELVAQEGTWWLYRRVPLPPDQQPIQRGQPLPSWADELKKKR